MKLQDVLLILVGFMSTCNGQGRLHTLSSRWFPCSARCQRLSCPGAFIPPGKCCPVCPEVRYPLPKKKVREPDCSAVLCPVLEDCFNPYTPPGECCQKCGTDCRLVRCQSPPIGCETFIPPGECCQQCRPRTCIHNDDVLHEGERIKVDCNTCTCRNGQLSCTEMSCQEKLGRCPRPTGPSHCAILCSHDSECPESEKCCDLGCGIGCVEPIKDNPEPDCNLVDCRPLPPDCQDVFKPAGQCCPICATSWAY